jgi:hypothetical protein
MFSSLQAPVVCLTTKRLILWSTLCISSVFNVIILAIKIKTMIFIETGYGANLYIYEHPNPSVGEKFRTLGWLPLHLFPLQPKFTLAVSVAALLVNVPGAISLFYIWLKNKKVGFTHRPLLQPIT